MITQHQITRIIDGIRTPEIVYMDSDCHVYTEPPGDKVRKPEKLRMVKPVNHEACLKGGLTNAARQYGIPYDEYCAHVALGEKWCPLGNHWALKLDNFLLTPARCKTCNNARKDANKQARRLMRAATNISPAKAL